MIHIESCPQHPNYLSWIAMRSPSGIIDLGRMECICIKCDHFIVNITSDMGSFSKCMKCGKIEYANTK